jgi:hypothetical protein
MFPIVGYARVIKVPDFLAPEEVNRAWVGLVIPYVVHKTDEIDKVREILRSKSEVCTYRVGVPWKEALEVLKKHSVEAADWWLKQPGGSYPESERLFIFGNDNLEDVSDC